MTRTVYVNGQYLAEQDAKISVFDRSFIFGDGVYEVAAVIGGRLVDCEAHLARLERSCAEIGIPLPWTRAELLAVHAHLIEVNGLDEGGIYLQVSRGSADRDFAFTEGLRPTLVLFTQAREISRAPAADTGIKVVTYPDLRWARRDIKSVNLLAPVLAKQFAKEKGAQEAWLLEGDIVTEGSSSTAWLIHDGKIISRPLSNKVLAGITRRSVLTLLTETNLHFEERPFLLREALDADEAFITSATMFVMPVVQVNDQSIRDGRPGPITKRLREIYLDFAHRGGALG